MIYKSNSYTTALFIYIEKVMSVFYEDDTLNLYTGRVGRATNKPIYFDGIYLSWLEIVCSDLDV